jgi:N-methylhydantoinase A
MLVTRGFVDLLDIGKEHRYDLFDLRLRFPEPVVSRTRRREIDERARYDGRIGREIDLDEVRAAVADLVRDEAIEALAICFLHSYANPAHERGAGTVIARDFPELHVSLSAEVAPFMREYERWTTTTVNAYAQPMVERYLRRLEDGLGERGFACRLHVMNSSGGTVVPEMARRFPVRLMESGPAAGVLMSAHLSRRAGGRADVLAFDMGGTTAKGALIRRHRPLRRYQVEVAPMHAFKRGSGVPLKIPAIDLIEIGSGGGGIATIDQRGLIQIGPRSAGADPGPACYGRGGEDATLTDANLILGYLDPAFFLGGEMALDREAAAAAIDRDLTRRLGLDTARAAWGIHETVNEDVARAFRVHAAERGFDYRGCTMVAFGGSGPAHALRIARKLGIGEVVFPAGAGVLSAFGLLASLLNHEIVRSERVFVDQLDAEGFAARLRDLADEVSAPLREAGIDAAGIAVTRRLDMRYRGQGYEVEVELPGALSAREALERLPELFAKRYEQVFSMSFIEQPLEIVNWKVEAAGPEPLPAALELRFVARPGKDAQSAQKGSREAYFPEVGGYLECPVYDRHALQAGQLIEGPL